MATVQNESGRAVLDLGVLPIRLRAFVADQARAIIAVSSVLLVLSFGLMMLLGRAGLTTDSAIDYQVYFWAVRTWVNGGDIMNDVPTVTAGIPLPWVYPPFALLPLLPFAAMPFVVGLGVMFVVDLLAIGAAVYVITQRMWPAVGHRGALAVAFAVLPWSLFLEPVYASLGLGQINIVLMGLVIVDCLARAPKWPRGLLVGFAAAVKLTPAAFLLFFLLRKDFRASITAVVTGAVCTLVGFALNFGAAVDYWFGKGPAHGVSGSDFHTNQSIMGGLARLELPAGVQDGIWLLLVLACTAAIGYVVLRADPVLAVLGTGLLALLISPTSWSDHWVWCVPAILVMLGYTVRMRSPIWGVVLLVTGATVLTGTFRLMPAGPPWTAMQHVVGNPYLVLGLVLVVALTVFAHRQAALPVSAPRPEMPETAPAPPPTAPV